MYPNSLIGDHLLTDSPVNPYPSLTSPAYSLPESPGKISFFYPPFCNLQWLPHNYIHIRVSSSKICHLEPSTHQSVPVVLLLSVFIHTYKSNIASKLNSSPFMNTAKTFLSSIPLLMPIFLLETSFYMHPVSLAETHPLHDTVIMRKLFQPLIPVTLIIYESF